MASRNANYSNTISRMSVFERGAKVEILPISGVLRVTIEPQPNLVLLLLDVAVGVVVWAMTIRQWSHLSLLMRGFYIWGDVSTVLASLYQLSGFERIEFGLEKLTIRKSLFGWERTREYLIEDCRELEWYSPGGGKSRSSFLRCKARWKSVHFAQYISQEQAAEVISALQQHFPQIAEKMGAMSGKTHFQTLGLSGK